MLNGIVDSDFSTPWVDTHDANSTKYESESYMDFMVHGRTPYCSYPYRFRARQVGTVKDVTQVDSVNPDLDNVYPKKNTGACWN